MDTKILEYVIAIAEEKMPQQSSRASLSFPASTQPAVKKGWKTSFGTPLFLREKKLDFPSPMPGESISMGHIAILQIKREALKNDFLHESQ